MAVKCKKTSRELICLVKKNEIIKVTLKIK